MKTTKIIVYHLDTGKAQTFKNMEALLKAYPSISEKRVEWCIRTGRRWRAMTFDEVES